MYYYSFFREVETESWRQESLASMAELLYEEGLGGKLHGDRDFVSSHCFQHLELASDRTGAQHMFIE